MQLPKYFPDATIYSFEPHRPTYEKLCANVRHLPKVKCYDIGFGECNNMATMFLTEASVGNSLLKVSNEISSFTSGDWTQQKDEAQVKVQRLETFCREQKIERIDLLKLDTQGYELKILEGAGRLSFSRKNPCHLFRG
jgi:FkbM family methyltransferase